MVKIGLGDICTIETGKWDANHNKEGGKYRFYTCAYQFGRCDTKRFSGECLILPGNGANVGEVFFFNGDFDAYQRTYVISHIKILPKFLYYHMLGSWKRINEDKQYGSATNYIRIGNFLDYKVSVLPFPEQRAIVAKIEQLFSELDNGIANFKTSLEQLKVYRQAVLKKAFEGDLTKVWRAKQTDLPTAEELLEQNRVEREKVAKAQSKKSKDLPPITAEELSTLPPITSSWKWIRLNNLAQQVFDGPFGANLKTSDYVESGIRVVRLENIKNLWFDDSKLSFISTEKYTQLEKHTVYPKDIIFSSFIADETKVASIPSHLEFAVNKADCFCIRPLASVSYKFLEYFLATRLTYSQLINEVHGATRPRINTTQLKSIAIPLVPLSEQNQIVQEIESRLSVCDKVEETIKDSLEKAEALRQSILKKAFEGKLLTEQEVQACHQQPDWEPAEKLLERIKKEGGKVANRKPKKAATAEAL